jgi:tRNA dimethylallyltransferase
LELVERLNAEIVSLDSMAIYRFMDIGTAKPTAEQRARVPHHLLDVVDPDHEFSLAQYVQAARNVVVGIRGRGREALFVGGTPLYLKALLRGICDGPPADWEFRQEIGDELERVGTAALHERLRQVDPLAAHRLHPNDTRRIIRALEVHRATGHPLSHLQTQFEESRPAEACRVFVLDWPRQTLHERINARVSRMIELGLVEEVRALTARFPRLSRTASQAVGYREVLEHLQGESTLAKTVEQIRQRTRQFAKRQATWFRSLSECRTLVQEEEVDPRQMADKIISMVGERDGQP